MMLKFFSAIDGTKKASATGMVKNPFKGNSISAPIDKNLKLPDKDVIDIHVGLNNGRLTFTQKESDNEQIEEKLSLFDDAISICDLRNISEAGYRDVKKKIAVSMVKFYNNILKEAGEAGKRFVGISYHQWKNAPHGSSINSINTDLDEQIYREYIEHLKQIGYKVQSTSAPSGFVISW